MKKIILIIMVIGLTSIFAKGGGGSTSSGGGSFGSNKNSDKYFLDLELGYSLMNTNSEYIIMDLGGGKGSFAEGASYKSALRAGYSFLITKNIFIEPSLGWGVLGDFGNNLHINNIYSVELPLLYRYEFIKYGLFGKYNYLADIIIADYNNNISVADKEAISLGIKTIFETNKINFIIIYEYILPKNYEETIKNGTQITNTNFNIMGSYISVGLRFKF